MSTRRLAEEALQPEKFAFSRDNIAWAEKRIALYPEGRQQSAVIPLLMRAQDQETWISRAAIETVAAMLDMPFIRVLEVATFYTQFQLQPVGTYAHVQVCGTTPCMLRGAEELRSVCQRKIHPDPHQRNASGTMSWEEVECLGACVNAPMVAIGHDTYEDLTPQRLEEILDAFEAGQGLTIRPGPQIERDYAAPVSGQTTLLETAVRQIEEPVETPQQALMFETPDGEADDLKLISGIGPVLEKKLNGFGVTQFAQVAGFSISEIQNLDEALNFKGRIKRDNWLEQAKALAIGVEEYVAVFGHEPG